MSELDEVHGLLSDFVSKNAGDTEIGLSECFDRRPISLMLVANNDQFERSKLIKITNVWRPHWLKEGVQVASGNRGFITAPPKKADLPVVKRKNNSFPLPDKLIRCFRDKHYDPKIHHVTKKGIVGLPVYHVDDLDQGWLATVNEEHSHLHQSRIQDWMLEDVIEAAEQICFFKTRLNILTDKNRSNLEYDEDAKCAICQSFNGEDGNELVFCEKCNVCVHQACYGIPNLPDGPWHCRLCEMGAHLTARCALCPNKGGAMKLIDDYKSWCHVSCALWIPEVSFQDVELMEPITHVNSIPQARKNLVCVLCKIHYGAPIQCSVKKCKVAFHVTCAFQHNMSMIQELTGSEVRLLGHCPKHSRKEYQSRLTQLRSLKKPMFQHADTEAMPSTLNNANSSPAISDFSPEKPLLTPERTNDPAADFHKHVTLEEVVALMHRWAHQRDSKRSGTMDQYHHQVPSEVIKQLLTYWRLKRRSNFNKPLVLEAPQRWLTEPLSLPSDLHITSDEVVERCKGVRLSLDRARIICDMVLSREKKKSTLVRTMKSISHAQLDTVVKDPLLVCSDGVIASTHVESPVIDPKECSASDMEVSTTEVKPAGYIMTGNPIVDSLPPDQLVVDPFIVARLRASFSRKRGRRRKVPLNGSSLKVVTCRQPKLSECIVPPLKRPRGRPRKALSAVQTNSRIQPMPQGTNGTADALEVSLDGFS